jgi:hypothetical protein
MEPRADRDERDMRRDPPPLDADPARLSRNDNRADAVGGADSVEKTSYASDVHGSEVGAGKQEPVPVTATVRSGGGFGFLGWGALLLAILAFAAYAAGLMR